MNCRRSYLKTCSQLSSHICLADIAMLLYPMSFNTTQTTEPQFFMNFQKPQLSFSRHNTLFPSRHPTKASEHFHFKKLKQFFSDTYYCQAFQRCCSWTQFTVRKEESICSLDIQNKLCNVFFLKSCSLPQSTYRKYVDNNEH